MHSEPSDIDIPPIEAGRLHSKVLKSCDKIFINCLPDKHLKLPDAKVRKIRDSSWLSTVSALERTQSIRQGRQQSLKTKAYRPSVEVCGSRTANSSRIGIIHIIKQVLYKPNRNAFRNAQRDVSIRSIRSPIWEP